MSFAQCRKHFARAGSWPAPICLALLIPFLVLRGLALPRAFVFNTSLRPEMVWSAWPALVRCDLIAACILALAMSPLAWLSTSRRRGVRMAGAIAQGIALVAAVLLLAIQYRVWREVGFYPNFDAILRFAAPTSPFLQSARSFTDAATLGELALVMLGPPVVSWIARRFKRTAATITASAVLVALASLLFQVDPPMQPLASHPYLQLLRPSSAAPDPRNPDISPDPPSLDSIAGRSLDVACEPPGGRHPGQSFVVVVLESTADQYLFPDGRARFPHLERIARQSIRFPRYYAPAGTSNPAMFTLLSGRHAIPAEEWWDTPRDRAADAMPALLMSQGYKTAFFMSGCFRYFFDEPLFRNMGWTTCLDGDDLARQFQIDPAQRDPSGHCVDDAVSLNAATQFIDNCLSERTPSFTLLYTGIPHMPYDFRADSPHALHREESLTPFQRYENQLAYVDTLLGRLFDRLVARGFFKNGLLVITADHGEAFGQHEGNHVHGAHLFDENTRVPLLIVRPSLAAADCLLTASHLDFAPTLLDLAGLVAPPRMDGRSIFLPNRHGMIFLSAAHNQLKLGVVDWPYKAIHLLAADRTLLFDLMEDPTESRDLAAGQPDLTTRYRQWIKSFRYHYLTPDRLKNLPPAEQHYWAGRQALATGASPSFAASSFRQALVLRPDYNEARLALAECFYQLGRHALKSKRPEEAALQYEEALRLNPEHTEARAALQALRAE